MKITLNYAPRHTHHRGTVYGLASTCAAALVLTAPIALMLLNYVVGSGIYCSGHWASTLNTQLLLVTGPTALTLLLPLAGMALGITGLLLRSKAHELVILGVLVNIAGIIAAIGVLTFVG